VVEDERSATVVEIHKGFKETVIKSNKHMKRSTAILAKKGVMGHADSDGDAKSTSSFSR
jgi:hypothetical protein